MRNKIQDKQKMLHGECMLDYLLNIKSISDPEENIEKALDIYYGHEHSNAHRILVENIDKLPYHALLLLFGQIKTPLSKDALEIRIRSLALIMKKTKWDGTWLMLDNVYEKRPINDPQLAGHITETYLYSKATPQEIILETRKYLNEKNIFIVRAALFEIFGWLATSKFNKEADIFVAELNTLAQNSDDNAIKQQMEEIQEEIAKKLRRN
jgi:hypothetical protein